MACQDVGGGHIGLHLPVGMADHVQEESARLVAHIPHVDVHHRQGRFDELGQGIVVKGHDPHVPGDIQPPLLNCRHAAHGDGIVGADNGIGQLLAVQELPGQAVALRPGGFSQPDIPVVQRKPRVLQGLADSLEPEGGAQVVILSAHEPDAPVAQGQEIGRRDGAGVDVVVVDPADLALEIRHPQNDVGEAEPGQKGGQGMGQDGNVDGQGIRAAAGDDFLGGFADIGRVHSTQGQPVALGTEGFLQAGNDFKHMGIPEGPIGGKIRQHGNFLCDAPGEALGTGAGVVVQLLHDLLHPPGGFLGNAVVAVDDLGNRGDGCPRGLRHVLDGYAHN